MPVLLDAALAKRIELWAYDLYPMCYIQTENKASPSGSLTDVDFVFVVTPDKAHCDVADFWLDRLSSTGAVFIEKPLDASLPRARQFHQRDQDRDRVYGFDHYLAVVAPFRQDRSTHLQRIGAIKRVDCRILEALSVPQDRTHTLEKGLAFDLLGHALSVTAACLSIPASPGQVQLTEVKAARCNTTPAEVSGETFTKLDYVFGATSVQITLGKYVGDREDKQMVITGTSGRIVLDLASQKEFVVLDKHENVLERANLTPQHVASFLEALLQGTPPLQAPGVMDFDTALGILELLDEAKQRIEAQERAIGLAEYHKGDSVDTILKRIAQHELLAANTDARA
jgi:predicted dehydrogenase